MGDRLFQKFGRAQKFRVLFLAGPIQIRGSVLNFQILMSSHSSPSGLNFL